MQFIRNIDFDKLFYKELAKYRKEAKKINISLSFPIRAKCKKCCTGPCWYFYLPKITLVKTISQFVNLSESSKKWLYIVPIDRHLGNSPAVCNFLSRFRLQIPYKNYKINLHRTIGNKSTYRFNIIDVLCCACGKTMWAFNSKSTESRPDIIHRKGRYCYPKKF